MSYVDRIKWRLGYSRKQTAKLFWTVAGKFSRPGPPPVIKGLEADSTTIVDSFWGEHTVHTETFKTAYQSEKYLQWRSGLYPLFAEFMNLYGVHDDEVVLDYGCGPGNDVVGFAIYTRAKKIIGIDISEKALLMARERLALHHVAPERVELIHSADTIQKIMLDDESVDYIHCAGVLHHTSNPPALLAEFKRILKPGAQACVMVYNRDSVWLHLHAAYENLILQNKFPGMTADEAFHKTVDLEADGTSNCPIARCYTAQQFISLCEEAGFRAEYLGGYLSDVELNALKIHREAALQDERLPEEHRRFLSSLDFDEQGLPMHEGKHAGIGGVYRLYKK
jgi:ubiquinone/menaquinone biosynthesis C-methylase UbiE